MFDIFTNFFTNELVLNVIDVVLYSAYVWVPVILVFMLWDLFVNYRRALFFAKQEYVLLEIKLPKEIFKSPKAMEFCIASLHSTIGEGNWYEKYWEGKVRAYHSLEIVSIDGFVHFFIWGRKGSKNQIESNLYSQYPGIEIYEVPDYTLPVTFDPEISGMWMTEFKLTKPDAFPIKTYIDYEMDKDPKEEFKIDPMTPLIEFLGSLPKGNQVWIQIIIRAHVAEEKDPKKTFTTWKIWETWKMEDKWDFLKKKDLRWEEAAKDEIAKIILSIKGEKDKEGKFIPGTGRQLTDIEKDTINALGRSVSKKGFDVGMRVVYIAPKDVFSMGNVGGVVGGIMHFNSSLNGFQLTGTSSPKYRHFLLAWKDRSPKLLSDERKDFLAAYKKRAYFHEPHRKPHFVLNTEELATLFHLPGGVSATPTFGRIESKKGQAPSNLPV